MPLLLNAFHNIGYTGRSRRQFTGALAAEHDIAGGVAAHNNCVENVIDNSELYAIAGRNEEKLKAYAAPFKPQKTYTDYQALLDDENVDAVYLPLPNGVHKEWVLKAAAAGKHILCEKPMSLTEADVREMFAAAKAHGVLLEEAYAYRHAQLAQKVKEIVDSGAIGRIRYIESKHSTYDTNRSGIRYQKGNGGGAVSSSE